MIHQSMKPDQQQHQAAHYEVLHLRTDESTEFRDITQQVQKIITQSGIRTGFANVQSMHTTAGILLNEHEPMLLDDMRRMMDRISPSNQYYAHDDLDVRTVNLAPEERENGHSHCRAMFLRSAEMLNVIGGRLQLGRWQRLFFVDFDGGRNRAVSVVVLGVSCTPLRPHTPRVQTRHVE